MIYVFGLLGFVIGFAAGLFIINLFLRTYPRIELVKNRSLRWTYGLFVWIVAGCGSYLGVWLYNRSFF